ncbi:MAG: tetratricopeptide repeat protein [Gammaproteobacteria bacterium]|nr:tetratricopeptide repeat protein [Gammaproteobacteria bacterium]
MKQLELDDEIYEKVKKLSKKGDDLFDGDRIEDAINEYNKALKLIPEPVYDWEASTWLFTAIGDAYWELADLNNAYDAFYEALRSPGGIGNPFIHLRVGQIDFEMGNVTKARDELIRAYMGAGKDIFKHENPKYFSVIEELV